MLEARGPFLHEGEANTEIEDTNAAVKKQTAHLGGLLKKLMEKSALGELQGLGSTPAKHPVISSLST